MLDWKFSNKQIEKAHDKVHTLIKDTDTPFKSAEKIGLSEQDFKELFDSLAEELSRAGVSGGAHDGIMSFAIVNFMIGYFLGKERKDS